MATSVRGPAAPAKPASMSSTTYSDGSRLAISVGNHFREVPMARLTAPVTERRLIRPQSMRFMTPMSGLSVPIDNALLEDKQSQESGSDLEDGGALPSELDIWARYGFVDSSYARSRRRRTGSTGHDRRRGPGAGSDETGSSSTQDGGNQHPRRSSDPFDGRRRGQLGEGGDYVAQGRGCPASEPNSSGLHPAVSRNCPSVAGQQPLQHPAVRPSSSDVGTNTPPTVILTPSSQERYRDSNKATASATLDGGITAKAAEARIYNPNALVGGARARDSMAAAFAASTARARASSSSVGLAPADAERVHQERDEVNEESKQEDRASSRDADSILAQGSDGIRKAENSSASSAHCESGNSSTATTMSGGSTGRRGHVRPANRHRPQRTVTEVERHRRNRAERLRAYGCSRTLYPRIQPEPFSGSHDILEEVETQQWVETLRVSASLRGESLMAACTASFAQQRAASLRKEEQEEARASRTADVSKMEGPDGLLHCAVLKGDHPLAARAAQFLVDKGGANVNSRDEWGRTPLHTAAGMGIVSMARFFVRRGANLDARDQDDRTPLYFACAGGHTTMARFLTRVEVGARVDLRDTRGHLAGEYFWETVSAGTQEDIVAILVAAGWPDPPPPRHEQTRSRGPKAKRGGGKGQSQSQRSSVSENRRRSAHSPEPMAAGGKVGMKRLGTGVNLLMRRR